MTGLEVGLWPKVGQGDSLSLESVIDREEEREKDKLIQGKRLSSDEYIT